MPDASGESRAERNAKFNQAHKTPEPPDIPDEVEHVWAWFWQLSAQRQSGPEPIGWDALGHWAARTQNNPSPEEIDMLLAMDGAFRAAVRDVQKGVAPKADPAAKPAKQFKKIT